MSRAEPLTKSGRPLALVTGLVFRSLLDISIVNFPTASVGKSKPLWISFYLANRTQIPPLPNTRLNGLSTNFGTTVGQKGIRPSLHWTETTSRRSRSKQNQWLLDPTGSSVTTRRHRAESTSRSSPASTVHRLSRRARTVR